MEILHLPKPPIRRILSPQPLIQKQIPLWWVSALSSRVISSHKAINEEGMSIRSFSKGDTSFLGRNLQMSNRNSFLNIKPVGTCHSTADEDDEEMRNFLDKLDISMENELSLPSPSRSFLFPASPAIK